jgi:RNA polymerase sporulation-specific sigma factor
VNTPPPRGETPDGARTPLSVLLRAKDGDAEAAGLALSQNTGLIWSVARRFFGRGCDPDDLFQLGSLGFLKALRGFDPEFGTQFSTYAVPKIAGEIRRFLRDDGAVKVSRGIKEQAAKIRAARYLLEQRLGREPTISELAAETSVTPEDIAAAEIAVAPPESFQRESGGEGFTLEQRLSDPDGEERLLERVAIREAVAALPERERGVIALRYYRGITQDAASRVLGISQVQVSRLERRAIERLRESLGGE